MEYINIHVQRRRQLSRYRQSKLREFVERMNNLEKVDLKMYSRAGTEMSKYIKYKI